MVGRQIRGHIREMCLSSLLAGAAAVAFHPRLALSLVGCPALLALFLCGECALRVVEAKVGR